jgi:hypothetical protein
LASFELRRAVIPGFIRSWWPISIGLLLVLHAVIGSVVWFTPRFEDSIASSAITPELGVAYSAPVNFGKNSIYVLPADTNETPRDSELVPFEDGRALGPSHVLHAEIRQRGGGRYSHWNGSIIFSTSDGSDPRSNGRMYTIKSPTAVRPWLRVVFSALLLLVDVGFFVAFQKEILVLLRTRGSILLGVLALSTIAAAGLSAFGAFGTLVVAKSGMPADAALSIQALQHACLGCLISIGMWAAGAGVSRIVLRDPHAGLAQILIPAFPVSLVLLAGLVAMSLMVPHGRTVALAMWAASLLPLSRWRPPRQELTAAIKAALGIIPFAIAFGIWLGLLWHGPTETLSGSPSGDLSFYSGTIWSLAEHPYPFIDLGYENGATRGYFNTLFPALGAAMLHLPGFDPFLYLLASGGTSYILLSTLMLHFYVADRAPQSASSFAVVVLVLCFVVAVRYPYWVAESIPVVFVPALTIAVWWMAERGGSDFRWTVAAMVAGLSGSILSKVATAAVLVPLGATGLWRTFWLFPPSVRAAALAVGGVFGVYCIAMLLHFLPLFIGASSVGPESFRSPEWCFICRDVGILVLALLAWLVADVPVALALTIGLLTFLLFSFVFQINFVCATLVLGLIIFTGQGKFSLARPIAFLAFALALPAVLFSDPAGTSSGFVWVVCLGGAVLMAVFSAVQIRAGTSPLKFRTPLAIGLTTVMVTWLGLVGVARGYIIVNSGWNLVGPQLTPGLADIWSAVRRLTPRDALIFTDQVDETINVLGGWNTYAFRGQRQLYLSSYYTVFELRADRAKLREILAINEAVLNGTKSPTEVPTRSRYENVFGVISGSRAAPSGWKKIYSNNDYAIFKIIP